MGSFFFCIIDEWSLLCTGHLFAARLYGKHFLALD